MHILLIELVITLSCYSSTFNKTAITLKHLKALDRKQQSKIFTRKLF